MCHKSKLYKNECSWYLRIFSTDFQLNEISFVSFPFFIFYIVAFFILDAGNFLIKKIGIFQINMQLFGCIF